MNAAAPGEFFPWRRAMALGLGRLRLAPDVFWAMTPRELQAAIDGLDPCERGLPPPRRDDFAHLASRFPDHL